MVATSHNFGEKEDSLFVDLPKIVPRFKVVTYTPEKERQTFVYSTSPKMLAHCCVEVIQWRIAPGSFGLSLNLWNEDVHLGSYLDLRILNRDMNNLVVREAPIRKRNVDNPEKLWGYGRFRRR